MFVYVFLLFAYRCFFFNDFFVVVFITVFFFFNYINPPTNVIKSFYKDK